MLQDNLKKLVAKAALNYIVDNHIHNIIGVGTGSTVHYFIEALASIKHNIEGTVASSIETENLLKAKGIPVFDLNVVNPPVLYVDSADVFNPDRQLVKGGHGALAREKVLAAASEKFLCLVDATKEAKVFGEFPIPIEVLPMARSYVAREIVKLKGDPVYRQHFVTDNGNIILDVYNWHIVEPIPLEKTLNNIAGVVANGLFANHPADIILVGSEDGVRVIE